MNIKYALKTIDALVLGFRSKNKEERLISYSSIIAILTRLEEISKDKTIPNYDLHKHELIKSCEVLCGLDDENGHDESTYISWALSTVDKLESVHCFNVRNQG